MWLNGKHPWVRSPGYRQMTERACERSQGPAVPGSHLSWSQGPRPCFLFCGSPRPTQGLGPPLPDRRRCVRWGQATCYRGQLVDRSLTPRLESRTPGLFASLPAAGICLSLCHRVCTGRHHSEQRRSQRAPVTSSMWLDWCLGQVMTRGSRLGLGLDGVCWVLAVA